MQGHSVLGIRARTGVSNAGADATCVYLELWLAYSLAGAGSLAAVARGPDTGPRPVRGANEHSASSPDCSCCFLCAPAWGQETLPLSAEPLGQDCIADDCG